MAKKHPVHVKRIYDEAAPADGTRVLVDRLWPRGVSRSSGSMHVWLKAIAPSSELRTWVHEDMDGRWGEFAERYLAEVAENEAALAELRALHARGAVTLLYASRETERNHALVLKELLES